MHSVARAIELTHIQLKVGDDARVAKKSVVEVITRKFVYENIAEELKRFVLTL